MFGGRLCCGSFHFTAQDQCVVAFGNRIYLYDQTARCQAVLFQAKQPIVAFCSKEDYFVCIDSAGNITQFNQAHEVLYQASIKAKIDRAVISEYGVYISDANQLFFQAFNKKPKEKKLHECEQPIEMLSLSGGYLLFAESNNLHVIDTQKPSQVKSIQHPRKVTAAWVDETNLVVGDERGVITTYLKELGEKEGQTLVQHWHVHSVKALYGTPFALISGGEQGVAVLWHRTSSKKDFLPRFGAEILAISSNDESTMLAFSLSDNTVKIVDTNNNNEVVTVKQIIDPKGTKTQRSIEFPNANDFPAGIHFNPQNLLLCTNSSPGKLQFIDVSGTYFTEEGASILEVVQRNWVSRLDDCYPCPAQLTHVSFSENWTRLLVVSETAYQARLHFYEYQENWKLVCKVDNTERVLSVSGYTCSETQRHRFLTVSESGVRIWREYAPKEKADSYYKEKKIWNCEGQFNYRQMIPTNLHCSRPEQEDVMTVTYPDHVVCVNLSTKSIIRQIKVPGVEEAVLLNNGLLIRTASQLQLYGGEPRKVLLNLKADKILSLKLNNKSNLVAVHMQQHSVCHIAALNLITLKATHSFKLEDPIESYFWADDNLLLLTQTLQLVEIIHTAHIFKQQLHTPESEDEAKETTDSSVAPDISFVEHYRKELKRQLASQQKSKLTREIFTEATSIPSFAVSFGLLASQLQQ